MSKGLPYSLGRGSKQSAPIVKQSIVVKDLAIEVDGATGVGFGSAVMGDLPEGNILFLGAVAYMQFTKDADASGITATWSGNYSIGTTATSDATLDTTDANVVASVALSAATSGVSPLTRGTNATQSILDNTDNSLELNLNLTIADAAISADDQGLTVDGVLHISYIVLGDD